MTISAAERTRLWRLQPGNIERERETKRLYKETNPERWKTRKQASSARYAEKNREEIRAKANELRATMRLQVIEAYGGRCNCPGCHVHHVELLTVDHVGGGAHHRLNRSSTRDNYRKIIAAGFPPEFQLLCGSCNLAKSDGDACPLSGEDH